MNTFIDLYDFLQQYQEKSIIKWLETPWEGKDKQESLLRLFASFGVVKKLSKFKI
jgi:hypothetical protein